MKNSRPVRISKDAWEAFYQKQQKMQKMIQEDLKLNKKLPMSDVIRFFSQKQTIVYPDEIKWFMNSKNKRRLI